MTRVSRLLVVTLISLACAPAAGKPRCGPGTRCGPPGPPPVKLVPLAEETVRTIVTTETAGTRLRAVVIATPAGAGLVVERWTNDTGTGYSLAAQRRIAFRDVGDGAAEAVRDPRWLDDDTLAFALGRDRDAWLCRLEGASAGADRAACVVARGGGRPTAR